MTGIVAPGIWSSIPRNYKEYSSVKEFKAKIKFWYPENCSCKLSKNYIYQIGYRKNKLSVTCWCFCYLLELVQRPQSGTQSVRKYLTVEVHLLWQQVNWFALQSCDWFLCDVGFCWDVRGAKCGDFVWFLGGKVFVGRTVLAGVTSPANWVGVSYFASCNFWADYSIVLFCSLWTSTLSLI